MNAPFKNRFVFILSHLPELNVKRSDTRINVKAKQEYQDLLLIK